MKITKEQLKIIIKEEIEAVLGETRTGWAGVGSFMRDKDGTLYKQGVGSSWIPVDEPEEQWSMPKSDRTEEQIQNPLEWKEYLKLRNQGMQHNETIHQIGIQKLKGVIWHAFQDQYEKGQYADFGGRWDR